MFGRKLQDDKDQDTNDLLSKMFYRQECISSQTGESFIVADVSHLIEPLVGLLRDPLSVCSQPDSSLLSLSLYKGAIIQSKRFLLLSVSAPIYVHFLMEDHESTLQNSISSGKGEANILPWMYKRSKSSLFDTSIDMASAKSILIDLGSSYFGAWNNDTSAAAGRWFYEYYKRFGVKFDRVIAFEQSTLDPKVAWQQLPDDVFPIYTLINVGCSATGQFNPWRTLKAIARPHDNVVIKLDIDTPEIETALINQILNNPSIHSLIDELFFEHHVTIKEMMPHWGNPLGTLENSYVLFTKLRQLGIRMHSWP